MRSGRPAPHPGVHSHINKPRRWTVTSHLTLSLSLSRFKASLTLAAALLLQLISLDAISGTASAADAASKAALTPSHISVLVKEITLNIPAQAASFFPKHPLIACTVKPQTLNKYAQVLDLFTSRYTTLFQSFAQLGESINEHMTQVHHDDPRSVRKQNIVNLLCGLYIVDARSKTRLPLSHRSIKGWEKVHISKPTTPFTRDIFFALVMKLLNDGNSEAAVCLTISWAGLLRVNEALSLLVENVALPIISRIFAYGSDMGGIAVINAKTGPYQFVFIKEQICLSILSCYIQKLCNSRQNMFTIYYQTYSSRLRQAVKFFELKKMKCTSHSARIRGALHSFMQRTLVADIAIKRRWNFITSLRHYVTIGRAWLMKMAINELSQQQIAAHRANLIELINRYRRHV